VRILHEPLSATIAQCQTCTQQRKLAHIKRGPGTEQRKIGRRVAFQGGVAGFQALGVGLRLGLGLGFPVLRLKCVYFAISARTINVDPATHFR
jgi:hypothetical protein